MRVYNPQISVLLIKAERRTEIAPGLKAIQSRYNQLDTIDLTPYLDDSSSIQVTKSTRQPSGTFSLRFSDKKHPELLDTIYALCAPMDIVEIRIAHDATEIKDGVIPLVMRGFVSSTSRSESIGGNSPQRFVSILGHDFMKILQIYRVVYKPFMDSSFVNLQEFKFFHLFAGSDAVKNMSGNAFAELVVENIVNPYMADITSLTKVDTKQAVNQWGVNSSISGSVSAYAVSSFNDASLYEILRTVLDLGVWNEMYMDETESAPVLTIRPVPFKDISSGDFLQGSAESYDISSSDIVSQQVARDDASTSNYFWVANNRMAMMNDIDQMGVAGIGDQSSFVKFDYLNSKKSVYGIRMLEVETNMGDEFYTDTDAAKAGKLVQQSGALLDWQSRRRELLAKMNQDNVIFESGSMTLRGQNIKPGVYINVFRGANQVFSGECYAHTVSHNFIPFNSYMTTVQFDRGTFFATRAQFSASPYIYEIENGNLKDLEKN